MRFLGVTTLLLGSLLPLIGASPVRRDPKSGRESVPDQFIVTLKDGLTDSDIDGHASWVTSIVDETLASAADGESVVGELSKLFNIGGGGLRGYTGKFGSSIIESIKNNENVFGVYPDEIAYATEVISQDGAPYGLARVSQESEDAGSEPEGTYYYDEKAGEGSYAYVIDSGVFIDHEEFEGRASLGFNAVPDFDHVDVVGHGTHVAGTIASRAYGVAKKADVISVKVFKEESGPWSQIIDGIEWAVDDIVSKKRQSHSVINLSLGGQYLEPINQAVESAVKAGITVVVAAGNEGTDAKNSSPASAKGAITVGAIDDNNRITNVSNFGDVLDIFAPGDEVLSAWVGSPDASNSISGTSMASPHVAGIVSLLQSTSGLEGPDAALKKLVELATPDQVKGLKLLKSGPNRIAYNGSGK